MKKKQETKQEKTITAHEKAFKAAEKKTRLQLAQVSDLPLYCVLVCITKQKLYVNILVLIRTC